MVRIVIRFLRVAAILCMLVALVMVMFEIRDSLFRSERWYDRTGDSALHEAQLVSGGSISLSEFLHRLYGPCILFCEAGVLYVLCHLTGSDD